MVFWVGKDLELKNQPSKGFSSKNNKIKPTSFGGFFGLFQQISVCKINRISRVVNLMNSEQPLELVYVI